MDKFENLHLSEKSNALLSAFLILILSLIGFMFIGPVIGFMISIPFFDGSFMEMADAIARPWEHPSIKLPIFITQGTATLTGLIVVPALYVILRLKKPVSVFVEKKMNLVPVVLTLLIVLAFMGVNSIFIEWNAAYEFPEFLKGFETWAKDKEELAAKITKYLTSFDNFGEFLIAFIVVAILPAIGEEFVFRGLIQNELNTGFKNHHIAIWVSAILFSAIHMQFFGFIPRMLLGALFGYLYYWSGNLLIPIIAHFINNGFTLIMVYLYQLNLVGFDIENTESAPLAAVLLFTIITAGLIFYFRNFFIKQMADT